MKTIDRIKDNQLALAFVPAVIVMGLNFLQMFLFSAIGVPSVGYGISFVVTMFVGFWVSLVLGS